MADGAAEGATAVDPKVKATFQKGLDLAKTESLDEILTGLQAVHKDSALLIVDNTNTPRLLLGLSKIGDSVLGLDAVTDRSDDALTAGLVKLTNPQAAANLLNNALAAKLTTIRATTDASTTLVEPGKRTMHAIPKFLLLNKCLTQTALEHLSSPVTLGQWLLQLAESWPAADDTRKVVTATVQCMATRGNGASADPKSQLAIECTTGHQPSATDGATFTDVLNNILGDPTDARQRQQQAVGQGSPAAATLQRERSERNNDQLGDPTDARQRQQQAVGQSSPAAATLQRERSEFNNDQLGDPTAARQSQQQAAGHGLPAASPWQRDPSVNPSAASTLQQGYISMEQVAATAVAAVTAALADTNHPSSLGGGSRTNGWTPTIAARLAGYTYAGAAQPSGFYRELLQERTTVSKKTKVYGVLNTLSQMHLEFSGFTPSPDFVSDVISLKFGADPNSNQWHRGLFGIGHFFNQSPMELQRQRHEESTREANPHVQQSLGHALASQSRPPPVGPSLTDFIMAFRRHSVFHLHTLGDGPINHLSKAIATYLQAQQTNLELTHWLSNNGPSLVYYFNVEANQFAHDVTTQHALDSGLMSQLSLPNPEQLAQMLCTRPPTATHYLPASLQGMAPPVRPPAPAPCPAPPLATPARSVAPPPGPPPAPTPATGGEAHIKPRFPPSYKTFWDSFHGRGPATSKLLSKVSLTPTQALAELGLPAPECYNYHGRGRCGNRRCTRQHTPGLTIQPAKATAHLAKLEQAKQQL